MNKEDKEFLEKARKELDDNSIFVNIPIRRVIMGQKLIELIDKQNVVIENAEKDTRHLLTVIELMAEFISVAEIDEQILDDYCGGWITECKHVNELNGCRKCICEYFNKKATEKLEEEENAF